MSSLIDELYNIHKGETALIIGNGPSLSAIPDELLKHRDYISFGVNRIWERFVPDYHVCVDDWVPLEWPEEYANLDSVKLAPDALAKYGPDYTFRHDNRPIWIREQDLHPAYMRQEGIAWVGAPHAAIQLALFMGCSKFILVGADNTPSGKHFYPDELVHREVDSQLWDWAFGVLRDCLIPKLLVNTSTETTITSLPRVDWKNYLA